MDLKKAVLKIQEQAGIKLSYPKHFRGVAFIEHQKKRIYLGKHGSPESLEKYESNCISPS